jgi:hypothetical protein
MDNMQPEMSIDSDGDTVWRLPNRKIHRADGPAVETPRGDKAWCLHNVLHRDDGPAIEFADGSATWHLHGKQMAFDQWLDQNTELTDEEKVMLKLQYG